MDPDQVQVYMLLMPLSIIIIIIIVALLVNNHCCPLLLPLPLPQKHLISFTFLSVRGNFFALYVDN